MQVPELQTLEILTEPWNLHFNKLLLSLGCMQFPNHTWKSGARGLLQQVVSCRITRGARYSVGNVEPGQPYQLFCCCKDPTNQAITLHLVFSRY